MGSLQTWKNIGVFVAVGIPVTVVGGSICFVVAMAFLSVVSSDVTPQVDRYVAIVSVVTVAVCYLTWPAVSKRISYFDKVTTDPLKSDDDSSLRLGIQDLRRRSRRCRLMSVFVLFFMVAMALLGFTVSSDDSGAQQSGESSFMEGGSLASLVLLVILIRILASVYRYNLRLSSFYDARADYLRLASSMKTLSHEELLGLVGTDELDTTSIREFWHSFRGRSSVHEVKERKRPRTRDG